MAMRHGLSRSGSASSTLGGASTLQRCIHAIAQHPPFGTILAPSPATSPPMVLPEPEYLNNIDGSLELMAVPKKRTSHHKKRIRNGPKFLKPAPVILRCTVCGRVKLQHFFCCSGIKEDNGSKS